MRLDGATWHRADTGVPAMRNVAPAQGADAVRSHRQDVDSAHSAAVSAFRNERFGAVLRDLTNAAASDSLMMLGARSAGSGVDTSSAFACYAESSD